MKIRRITSLTALLSFSFMILTAIILYIVPPGRVAYWSDWHPWGLSKTQWSNIHIILGLLLLISIKTFAGKVNLDLDESMDNLKHAGIRVAAENQTLLEIAKSNHLSPQQVYLAMKPKEVSSRRNKLLPDSPTPGMGRRTIADICNEYHLNIPAIMLGFARENIKVSADMSLKKIAEGNNLSALDVYEILRRLSAG